MWTTKIKTGLNMGVAVNLSRFCHKTLILPCSKQIPDQTRMFDFEKIGGGGKRGVLPRPLARLNPPLPIAFQWNIRETVVVHKVHYTFYFIFFTRIILSGRFFRWGKHRLCDRIWELYIIVHLYNFPLLSCISFLFPLVNVVCAPTKKKMSTSLVSWATNGSF